jgi:hypothetical protein
MRVRTRDAGQSIEIRSFLRAIYDSTVLLHILVVDVHPFIRGQSVVDQIGCIDRVSLEVEIARFEALVHVQVKFGFIGA